MKPFILCSFVLSLLPRWAVAADLTPPMYTRDPFHDSDFADAPLLQHRSNPGAGRAELALFAALSIADKYNAQTGAWLDVLLQPFDTVAFGASLGLFQGQLTPIVTDAAGILGNRVQGCISRNTACGDITPQVPDYRQVTGVVDVLAYWLPLYGKISLLSGLDVNLQIYGLLGGGINGTRSISATVQATPQQSTDYVLHNNQFLDGGLFNNATAHLTVGYGVRLYLSEALSLRLEVRSLIWRDTFAFNPTAGPQGYGSSHWFAQGGLAWAFL